MPYRPPRRPSKKAMRFVEAAYAPLIDGGVALEPPERKQRTKRNAQPEAAFQRTLMAYLRRCLPPGALAFYLNNSARTDIERMWNAGIGALKGAPDIEILYRGEGFFLECKSLTGKLSQAQSECHDMIEAAGCRRPVVVRTIEEAQSVLMEWCIPMRVAKVG